MPTAKQRLWRFSLEERAVHWLIAICFLYAALTGLSLWSHTLYWLASVFGGGEAVRWGHPWGGTLFAAFLAWMYRNWAQQMRLDDDDGKWLRSVRKYAQHDESGVPEAGRFNAGQKLLFWTQGSATALLFLSGLVLWFPASAPRPLLEAAIVIHPTAAVVSISGIILHIYMGTAATPGAFRGMVQGWVSPAWAAAHHPKWFRQNSRQ